FKEKFNAFSPVGIKCVDFRTVENNPNYANGIESCTYEISGIAQFDPNIILSEKTIETEDLRGRKVDIRPRIYAAEYRNGRLLCTLGCGNSNLRPDLFAKYLCARFGGKAEKIFKLASHGKGVF
ncbi:MAG: DUF2344 domain-containing protein, partial [Clostridia bacterium]|nr:DUF2344 domain-containing protein [Clostridia bacterium]